MKRTQLYLTDTEHDVLSRMLTCGIHIDALTPSEMLAVNSLRVQCGLEPIRGIEEVSI